LFAPGITNLEHIATLVRSVDRPVNVLISVPGMLAKVQQLFDVGVRRISVGGSFARAAYGEVLRAAAELQTAGTLDYTHRAISGSALNSMLGAWRT
jgi:2-methylisocitrate lyase-like PEP mutase family enzyme